MLEMAVLGLLKEQEMHGYELKKQLADVFGLSGAVSFGSLYPALARLEVAGAVRVIAQSRGTSDAGSDGEPLERRSSRRRKVYSITPLGAQMFEDLLADSRKSGDDDRSFNLRLAFARYLPPEARLGMLEQRRAVLGERLAQMAARARARREDRYMLVLSERQQEELSSHVSWLDRLIREERDPVRGGGPATAGAEGRADGLADWRRQTKRLVPLASASQLQRPRGPAGGGPAGPPRSTEP